MDIGELFKQEQLPSLPAVAVRILQLVDDPSAGSADLAREIRNDSAISLQLLRLANSPAYLPGREVTSVDLAVSLLGRHAVASTALTFSLSQHVETAGDLADEFEHYWRTTVLQAISAELLAGEDRRASGDYFLVGLLSDIGRLALLCIRQQEYAGLCRQAREQGQPLVEAEEEFYGFTHVTVSARLAAEWGLPDSVIHAIRQQHRPLTEVVMSVEDRADAVTPVASTIAELFLGVAVPDATVMVDKAAAELFDTTTEDLLNQARQRVEDLGHVFDVDAASLPSVLEIMTDANRQLASLLMNQQGSSTFLNQHTEGPQPAKTISREDFEDHAGQFVSDCTKAGRHPGLMLIQCRTLDDARHDESDRFTRHAMEVTQSVLRSDDCVSRLDSHNIGALCSLGDATQLEQIAQRVVIEVIERWPQQTAFACIGGVALADPDVMTALQMQQLAFFRLDRARKDDSSGIEILVYPEVPAPIEEVSNG